MTSSNYPQNQTMNSTAIDSLLAMFNITEVDSFSSLRTTPGVSANSGRESFKKRPDGWFHYGKDGYGYEEYGYGYEEYGYGYEEYGYGYEEFGYGYEEFGYGYEEWHGYGDDENGCEEFLDRNTRVILIALIVLAGIFGNILALVVIAAVKSMHTTVNKCLFSLGIADLLLLVILSPDSLVPETTLHLSVLGRAYCILYVYIDRGVVSCSILSALYITVDRFIALCYPFYPRRFSSGKKIYVILVAIWAVAMVLSSPYLYVVVTASTKNCDISFDHLWFRWYDLAIGILFQFIPFPILVILSGKMIYVVSHKVPSENDPGKTRETASSRGRNQVVIMLLAVVIIFVICHLPHSIVSIVTHSFADLERVRAVTAFAQASGILIFFNSAINPVLYFSLSSKFRCAFKELFTTCRKKRSA